MGKGGGGGGGVGGGGGGGPRGAPLRIRVSVMLRASSPLSGWEIMRVIHIHPHRSGITRIERVLHINKNRIATGALGLRDERKTKRRLTRGLRAVDFADAPARKTAHAESQVD